MGAGKILCIIGGLISLVATLFFSFFSSPSIGYGIGLFLNFATIFSSGNILGIVFGILYAIGVVSGLFILIGAQSRALAIIGSIFALLLGVLLLLITGLAISLGADIDSTLSFFIAAPLVDGIIPFELALGLGSMSLGTVLLVGGGVLGLIGGIVGTSD